MAEGKTVFVRFQIADWLAVSHRKGEGYVWHSFLDPVPVDRLRLKEEEKGRYRAIVTTYIFNGSEGDWQRIGRVPLGAEVVVIGAVGPWLQIASDRGDAYVWRTALRRLDDAYLESHESQAPSPEQPAFQAVDGIRDRQSALALQALSRKDRGYPVEEQEDSSGTRRPVLPENEDFLTGRWATDCERPGLVYSKLAANLFAVNAEGAPFDEQVQVYFSGRELILKGARGTVKFTHLFEVQDQYRIKRLVSQFFQEEGLINKDDRAVLWMACHAVDKSQ